jgi:UDP-glucose 4-epimerase
MKILFTGSSGPKVGATVAVHLARQLCAQSSNFTDRLLPPATGEGWDGGEAEVDAEASKTCRAFPHPNLPPLSWVKEPFGDDLRKSYVSEASHQQKNHLSRGKFQHYVVGIDLLPAATTTHIADIANITDWSPYLDGVDAVIHFAALHAPHRETHSRENFYATNVDATARLLHAAKSAGVKRVVMASTTSVYGRAMRSKTKAVWVTEALSPISEDIYDETKLAAEAICREAFSQHFITVALRFSRSFPEPLSLMAQYRLHRGVDARDVAHAFSQALIQPLTQFEAFNISGATPFLIADCDALMHDAPAVLRLRAPEFVAAFSQRNWALPKSIDRVYVIDKAIEMLGYKPQYSWQSLLPTSAASVPLKRPN